MTRIWLEIAAADAIRSTAEWEDDAQIRQPMNLHPPVPARSAFSVHSYRQNAQNRRMHSGTGGLRTPGGSLQQDALTRQVIGCFFTAYNELGFGFTESIYSGALEILFRDIGLLARREHGIDVMFRDIKIGTFRVDYLIEETEGRPPAACRLASAIDHIPSHVEEEPGAATLLRPLAGGRAGRSLRIIGPLNARNERMNGGTSGSRVSE